MIEWFILTGDLGVYDILLESDISKTSISVRFPELPIVILGDSVEGKWKSSTYENHTWNWRKLSVEDN